MEVILIILAIIGGLSGFLKDKSDDNSGNPKRSYNTLKPSSTPSGGSTSHSPATSYDYDKQTMADTAAIEVQQEEQRNSLAERMETTHKARTGGEHDAIIDDQVKKEPDKDLSMEQKRLRKRFSANLNQKSLVNGIIMSEVLGQPRAYKPYQSIVSQRRK